MTNKELKAQVAELQAQLEAQPACPEVDLTAISPDAVLEAQGYTEKEIAQINKADEEHPRDFRSFKALCDALLEATGETSFDAKGQSGRIILERNKVAFTLREKEEVTA